MVPEVLFESQNIIENATSGFNIEKPITPETTLSANYVCTGCGKVFPAVPRTIVTQGRNWAVVTKLPICCSFVEQIV